MPIGTLHLTTDENSLPILLLYNLSFPSQGTTAKKKKKKELKHSLFIPVNSQVFIGFQSLLVEIIGVTCKKRILPYMSPAAENNRSSPTEELLSPWQQVNLRYVRVANTLQTFCSLCGLWAWFCSPGKCQQDQQLRPLEPQVKCGADQTWSW